MALNFSDLNVDDLTVEETLTVDLINARAGLRVAVQAQQAKDTAAHRKNVTDAREKVDNLLDLYLTLGQAA
jgi:hypothetical protein